MGRLNNIKTSFFPKLIPKKKKAKWNLQGIRHGDTKKKKEKKMNKQTR